MNPLDSVLVVLVIGGVIALLGALGALLADWLESRQWFIDWHRKHYQGRFVERRRNMATRRR